MLSRDQLDLVPDRLLNARSTEGLLEWLEDRGWVMSLAELDSERRLRKGLSAVGARQMPPARKHSRHPLPGPSPTPTSGKFTAVTARDANASELWGSPLREGIE